MDAQEFDDRLRSHQELLEGLAKVWTRQGEINEEQREINDRLTAAIERLETSMESSRTQVDRYMARMDGYMDRMEGYMQRQEAVNASVSSTLGDIKTLLQRLVRGSGNGREA
jgi:chromosome segregation ATPase